MYSEALIILPITQSYLISIQFQEPPDDAANESSQRPLWITLSCIYIKSNYLGPTKERKLLLSNGRNDSNNKVILFNGVHIRNSDELPNPPYVLG